MFQFRRFPTYTYLIQCTLPRYCRGGFPHSEISGSMDICSSPKLFAAYRVLHRLSVPRHSPCALSSLTNRKLSSRLFSLVNYAGSYKEFEIVIVTLIFSDVVPQLNSHSLFPALPRGNLSVALLHFVIHCSVFKVHPLTTLAIRFEDPIPWILKSNNNSVAARISSSGRDAIIPRAARSV